MPKPQLHIKIIPFLFKDELACRGISIRSLGNPHSPNYIGITSRTIHRGLQDGYFTRRTIEALSDIMEVDSFVVDFDYGDYEKLLLENTKLKKQNSDLLIKQYYLEQRLQLFKQKIATIHEDLKSI